jgi:hypothetical protein
MFRKVIAALICVLPVFGLTACPAADTTTVPSAQPKLVISQERFENTAPAAVRKNSAHTVSPKPVSVTKVEQTASVPAESKSAAVLPLNAEERISPAPAATETVGTLTAGAVPAVAAAEQVPGTVKIGNLNPFAVEPSPAPSAPEERLRTASPNQSGSPLPEENAKPQPMTEMPKPAPAAAEKKPAPQEETPLQQVAEKVSGTMSIDFETRAQVDNAGQTKAGANDLYIFNLLIYNSLRFRGRITRQPRLESAFLGRELQRAELSFDVDLSLLNPDNSGREKQVSHWTGVVPIDSSGQYQLSRALVLNTQKVGALPELRDSFAGTIAGKGPEQQHLLTKLRQYSRFFGGRQIVIQSRHIDPIRFASVKLAAGPLESCPQTIVDGNLDYDYETGNWYTSGITFTLPNKSKDVVTGSIKWVEDENRKQNGKGRYEFNLRFNEARQHSAEDESAFFASAGDEELFFAVDPSMPGISGTISYVDAFKSTSRDSDEPVVVHSNVTYDLKAQNLSQTQAVNFIKLWLLLVGPVNDE